MKIPAHAKYQIIYDTLQKNDNLLNVAAMCEIAGVSRSGYYHYLSTEDQRMEREERDRQDFTVSYPQSKSLSENGKSNGNCIYRTQYSKP